MKLVGSMCLILTTLLAMPAKAQEPADITLVQLIANPEKFDGKLIRVIGFLCLEFEGDVLYLHREDYENLIYGDGIWVEVTPEIAKQSKTLNLNYVLLEGTFSSSDRGHMSMSSGSIKNIRRAELWPGARLRKRPAAPDKSHL